MAATYTAREGETVAGIAWAYYGSVGNRVVERILDANPGLADNERLASGTVLQLPEIEAINTKPGAKLWD